MRVIALLFAVVLIVIGGFWLARDRSAAASSNAAAADTLEQPAETDQSSTAGDQSTDDETAGEQTDAEDDGAAGEPDAAAAEDAERAAEDSEDAAAAAPSADDLSAALPEGYEPVEYLRDNPLRAFEEAEQVLEEGLDYVAVLRTNRGDFVVDLYEERTPKTVNNFVFLALNRYYQGVPFHRVLEDFMAQTGDPTGTGSGGPGYQFEDEIVDDLVFDRAGLLAMANAGPGTNGSQFFITFAPTPWLDGAHTIFGHLLAGEELLAQIARVDPSNPSAVVTPDETLAELATQGIELPGPDDQTVEDAIAEQLGTTPVAGQSFTVAGYRGVLGQLGGSPAYGFFQQPDTLLDVLIGQRPTS